MYTVLIIAKRELTRLRSRFTGKARPVVMLLLLGALLTAYLAYQQGNIQGRSLYRIGVSPDGPLVRDSRFTVVTLPSMEGHARVEDGTLDAYVDRTHVIHSERERSRYATGALKLYLENLELARIEAEYPPEQAFPLRVEVTYFPVGSREPEIIIPSLMRPPVPFAQVVTVSIYLLPVFMVSVFFTSGFMDEKADRRITVLLSAPVSPFQIILGKMLPYTGFALASVVFITALLRGKQLLALAIFLPVILFIFSIYLMVPLLYRTFKDTTFISMLATTVITSYLVFPAMFAGVNDLSYMSPLTLAVKMYRDQPFTLQAYLTSTAPMYLVFAFALYLGTRMLNEEYLMRYRSLYHKLAEALYLALNRNHLSLSITLLSLCLIPIVYMLQLLVLTISLNLPIRIAIGVMMVAVILVEEIAKSAGIVVLLENRDIGSFKEIVQLSFLSAFGFLVGEKLLLYVSISVVSQSIYSAAVVSAGKLWIPLVAHFIFTTLVTEITRRWSVNRYPYALIIGAAIHVLYNLYVLGVIP
ncbi:MAG: ABC transporter permease [Anaerolineae bacterium]|nr:ABC transporter permease [Anaerolineae bacterium]